jgi:hypothetical protein
MQPNDRLINGARIVVRITQVANRAFFVGVAAGLALSFLYPEGFARIIENGLPGADIAEAARGAQALMLLGLVMAGIAEQLLAGLAAIIATAAAGDPFIAANAERLRTTGWWLLALQLCEIPGALIRSQFPALGSAGPSGEFSIAGWIAVLMVFVLARVFAVGAEMRDDLAGTV